jgi:hypothetical protein
MGRLKPFDTFDRRERDPAEMMTSEDATDRIPMDGKLEMVSNEPGRTMLPLELEGDDLGFQLLRDSPIMSPPAIVEAVRAPIEELQTISFEASPGTSELLQGFADLNVAPDQGLNNVFFNSNR